MSDRFFFRIRGEVKGPYPREQILSLIRKKRLGRHHELSEDAVTWQRAGDVPGLFDTVIAEPITSQTTPAEPAPAPAPAPATVPQASTIPAHDFSSLHQASDAEDEWFYAKGRNTHGPVSSRELRALLATGRLLGSDRIWSESLSDWVPAEDVPQFMGSVTQTSTSSATTASATKKSAGSHSAGPAGFWDTALCLGAAPLPAASANRFPNLCRFLEISESIQRILFCLLCASASCAYLFLVCSTAYRGDVALAFGVFFGGLVALLSAILVLWLGFLSTMACLEMIRVQLRIEDNTSG
jgi:hypothetical protein